MAIGGGERLLRRYPGEVIAMGPVQVPVSPIHAREVYGQGYPLGS